MTVRNLIRVGSGKSTT